MERALDRIRKQVTSWIQKPTSKHLEMESEAVPERAGKVRSSISTFSKGVGWGHGRTCPIDTSILPV